MSFYVLKNLNRPSATGATDPATLTLALLCEASFTGAPWPGLASAGTSASHPLSAVPSTFTGQLGTSGSTLGNVELGVL